MDEVGWHKDVVYLNGSYAAGFFSPVLDKTAHLIL